MEVMIYTFEVIMNLLRKELEFGKYHFSLWEVLLVDILLVCGGFLIGSLINTKK